MTNAKAGNATGPAFLPGPDDAHWCGREDSNFHGSYPTATSTLRVYQFRHDRNPVSEAGDSTLFPACEEAMRRFFLARQERQGYARFMVEWRITEGEQNYAEALAWQEARVAAIRAGKAAECIWLLEHPPLLTAGTSAESSDLLMPERFPVFDAGRGGEYTYHGPGQRVAYVMLDLMTRGRDVRAFVWRLEEWVILALSEFGVVGERRKGRVGVWVVRPERPPQADGAPAEDKVAAIGVRLRRWVSFHGISINVEPDLSHFDAIVPCGIRGHGVTSLVDLGVPVTMTDVDIALRSAFDRVFGVSA